MAEVRVAAVFTLYMIKVTMAATGLTELMVTRMTVPITKL